MWTLAYPAIITMVSQTVMWTVDSAMVGRVGKIELAAVGLGGLLCFTLYAFFIGLSYSLNTYVSQSYGAGRYHDCARYMWQGVYLGVASGIVILGIRQFNPALVDVLGPSQEVRPLSVTYADIRMLGGGFFILQYYLSNFFRGIGNTMTPMKVAISANLVNVVLDYMLIFGHGPFEPMGVAGAAWATFVSNIVFALALFIIAMSARYRDKYGTHRYYQLRISIISRLLRVGLPIGLHYFLDIGAFLVFSAYIGRMGTDQLAVTHIMIQILSWSFLPSNGIGVAATTLMGQHIGAGRPDLAKRSGYRAIQLGLIYTGVIAVLYVLLPGPLIRIFNSDAAVVAFGMRLMYVAAVFQIFDGIQMVTSGALRGAGDTRFPMVLALLGSWLFFLPVAYFVGTVLDGGVVGAWAGATLYVVLLATGLFVRFKTEGWRHIRLDGIHDAGTNQAAG